MGPREITSSKDITVNPTEKSGKAGPRPWDLRHYLYPEKTTEEKKSHSDPALERGLRQHQESEFIPSDSDNESGLLAFGSDFIAHLDACASSPSDLGTLAGGSRSGDYAKKKMGKRFGDVKAYWSAKNTKRTPTSREKSAWATYIGHRRNYEKNPKWGTALHK